MSVVTANYDESWKEALNEYFPSFLSFFFPTTYELIDWTKTPEPLDKELQQITASSETESRVADKLYKVWLRKKPQKWVLFHLEVQSQYKANFRRRVYVYNYRIFDLYEKDVLSLVILGDKRPGWRPNFYEYNLGDGGAGVRFPSVKLIDYESRWDELESNHNPFAIITMAHLKTKATTKNPIEREDWKWKLIRQLYDRGLTQREFVKQFKIIDKMMSLPKQMQTELIAKIKRFEEERKMPLISPTEELAMERGKLEGIQQGIEQGIQQGEEKLVIRQLNRRIGAIKPLLIAQVRKLAIEQLELLGEALLDFSTVADLEQWLQNQPNSLDSSPT